MFGGWGKSVTLSFCLSPKGGAACFRKNHVVRTYPEAGPPPELPPCKPASTCGALGTAWLWTVILALRFTETEFQRKVLIGEIWVWW